MSSFISREVEHLVPGQPASDGAGVRLLRVLSGAGWQRRLDPFLMLDEFRSDQPGDYLAGFPEHPHRGFQTVTYMLAGRMRHRDSVGHEGVIGPGAVQWMNAGRGILHSEMPEQQHGLMHGFQLWINLPASRKLSAPAYRELEADQIPELRTASGSLIRVIAGQLDGVDVAIQEADTEPQYWDVRLPAGACEYLALPPGHHAAVYVYAGEAQLGEQARPTAARTLAVLSQTEGSHGVIVRAAQAARLLVLAGRPLHQPIAQWGPFVMNTRAEIEQAIADMRAGTLA